MQPLRSESAFLAIAAVAALAAHAAPAQAKGHKPPAKPVPQFWVGTFEEVSTDANGNPDDGLVHIVGTPEPPAEVVLINPFAPVGFADTVKDEGTALDHQYAARYYLPAKPKLDHDPVFIAIAAAADGPRPVRVVFTKSMQKQLVAAVKREFDATDPWLTFTAFAGVDLDGDGVTDVAMVAGCVGEGNRGGCASTGAYVLRRNGDGWTGFGPSPLETMD